ncbi:hypothetical protein DUI87_04602 [Hirundo rustica rustica]|uniref:Uncharacterized protein n=1 Tax=Hirundo rustica rustica TaxID=333673 RepID=A0A3M0L0W3_HIRRU|nr:hypothetical protein DUI87_04602 [Hirundo rustica rustica]
MKRNSHFTLHAFLHAMPPDTAALYYRQVSSAEHATKNPTPKPLRKENNNNNKKNCVVQPQKAAFQEEGIKPHMSCVGITASRERDTERPLVSMKASEREEKEIKERFGKRMREMDLTAKCYRRFLQPPSPSPERQTSRDSQDYF